MGEEEGEVMRLTDLFLFFLFFFFSFLSSFYPFSIFLFFLSQLSLLFCQNVCNIYKEKEGLFLR